MSQTHQFNIHRDRWRGASGGRLPARVLNGVAGCKKLQHRAKQAWMDAPTSWHREDGCTDDLSCVTS
eukprot:5675580-Amphidinium_carterae.1